MELAFISALIGAVAVLALWVAVHVHAVSLGNAVARATPLPGGVVADINKVAPGAGDAAAAAAKAAAAPVVDAANKAAG